MTRPTLARIDLDALAHNLNIARRHAGPAKVLAVGKANAYGHGLVRARQAWDAAAGIAVLEIEAAVRLRQDGYRGRVVLLEGHFNSEELELVERFDLVPVVHDEQQVAQLEAFRPARPLSLWLKLNSGMNRLGFRPSAFRSVLERLSKDPRYGDITLMTHFAGADEDHGVDEQMSCFREVAGSAGLPVSLANSAALLKRPDTIGDWVRPGIILYGASPFAGTSAAALGLQPVMTLQSRIVAEQRLAPGEAVGYGATFIADRPMRIGVVACGYADGYPRHAGTGTPVLVDGLRTRTLGRVSMDLLCVDLDPVAGAGVGSDVVLWGRGLPVDDVAAAAGTIGYELLCALAPRVRVEVVGGADPAPVAVQ